MKDINQVLSQKLDEARQCRIDIYCLKNAIRLLAEPGEEIPPVKEQEEKQL